MPDLGIIKFQCPDCGRFVTYDEAANKEGHRCLPQPKPDEDDDA